MGCVRGSSSSPSGMPSEMFMSFCLWIKYVIKEYVFMPFFLQLKYVIKEYVFMSFCLYDVYSVCLYVILSPIKICHWRICLYVILSMWSILILSLHCLLVREGLGDEDVLYRILTNILLIFFLFSFFLFNFVPIIKEIRTINRKILRTKPIYWIDQHSFYCLI